MDARGDAGRARLDYCDPIPQIQSLRRHRGGNLPRLNPNHTSLQQSTHHLGRHQTIRRIQMDNWLLFISTVVVLYVGSFFVIIAVKFI